jgi:hypothetical protein
VHAVPALAVLGEAVGRADVSREVLRDAHGSVEGAQRAGAALL